MKVNTNSGYKMRCGKDKTSVEIKMRTIIIVLLLIVMSFASAQRSIIPSAAVCAAFPNEEFAIDLRRCQNTCEFYGRTWDCPRNYYKPNGDCYCQKGFARLTEDGNCVSVTDDLACKAKLPITAAACTRPNEIFKYSITMGVCDVSCRTYGCKDEYRLDDYTRYGNKWAPNCDCQDKYRRLSNGTCVHLTDPLCKAEYKPSAARCSALGQVYQKNAPCQPTCYGPQYCPPAEGACICPKNKKAYVFYVHPTSADFVVQSITMISCHDEGSCPAEPPA